MNHPVPLETLPEAAQRALRGPPALKMMAARGMAPLPPPVLAAVLYALAYDPDEKLAAAARATLEKLPPPVLDGALAHADLPAAVLDDLATRLAARAGVLARIAAHANTAGETVARLAAAADDALCELIATNEQRLLAHPKVIEALYLNPACRMSTSDRLIELAARNGVELDIPCFKEVAASLRDELIPEAGELTPADEMFREAITEAAALEHPEDADVVDRDDEGEEKLKAKFKKVEKRLEDMKMSEKVRTAQLGSRSQRMILIRNASRVVAMAAVQSPKMQESDAATISASRQVSQDVLRYIGDKADWVRMYQIKRQLVGNPKTPQHTSLHLLPHLREVDLKGLQKSKGISQALRTAVNQLLNKRATKQG